MLKIFFFVFYKIAIQFCSNAKQNPGCIAVTAIQNFKSIFSLALFQNQIFKNKKKVQKKMFSRPTDSSFSGYVIRKKKPFFLGPKLCYNPLRLGTLIVLISSGIDFGKYSTFL